MNRPDMIRQAVRLHNRATEDLIAAEHLFHAALNSENVPFIEGGQAGLNEAMASDDGVVIVSFGARWCDQCAELLEHLEQAAAEGWTVYRFNLDSDPSVLERPGLMEDDAPPSKSGRFEHRIPMTVLFHHGDAVNWHYGPGPITETFGLGVGGTAPGGNDPEPMAGPVEDDGTFTVRVPYVRDWGDPDPQPENADNGPPVVPMRDLGDAYNPPPALDDTARRNYDNGYDCGRDNRWEPPPRSHANARKHWERGFADGKADQDDQ